MTWEKRMVFLNELTQNTLELREDEALVRLFGEVEIVSGGKTAGRVILKEGLPRTAFAYLILRRHQHVSLDTLAQRIWNDYHPDPLYDAVKNVIYRLKKALRPLGDCPLIVSDAGSFAINPDINIIVDVEILEKQHKCFYNTEFSEEMLLELYHAMISLHRGFFLTGQHGSIPIENLRTYYLSIYTDVVKKYLSLLETRERYLDMLDVVTKALEYEAHEPTLLWYQVHTLIKQRRFDPARIHYELAKNYLSDEQREGIEEILPD